MVDVFSLLFLALLLGLGLHFLLQAFAKQKPSNSPPGSMGWPLFGETLGFLKPHRSNSIGDFLQEHCSRYGRVFKSHLFGSPTVVSCDHELNWFVLQNEEKLFRASYPKAINEILGKLSILVVSGDAHRKLRNVGASFISASKSKPSFTACVDKRSISLLNSWRNRKEIGFYKEMKKFTLNVMLKHLLSIEPEEPMAVKILEDFRTFVKGFASLPVYIPGTAYASAVKARARLSATVREIIKKRRIEKLGVVAEEDFLDVVLSKGSLSDEETVSIVLDMLFGSYETTASVMCLIVYFLAHAPDALETLKQEHIAIRKSKDDGEPLSSEDYGKMEFTNNVMYEAMRCGNVVKFVQRVALQDVKFKGYVIPSGWKVGLVFSAAHFDPSLHENPLDFNPWRWTDKATRKKVMPFGGGPRLCPGADLAKLEIAFFLHHFLLNYRWKIMADDFPLAYPYVEFRRGLLLEIEPLESMLEKNI